MGGMPDVSTLLSIVSLVNVLWNAGITAVIFLRKPGVDAAKAVEELADDLNAKLTAQAVRLKEVETHMEHMPTSEDLKELEGTVKQVAEQTKGLAEGMSTVRASLGRIEDYLLKSR